MTVTAGGVHWHVETAGNPIHPPLLFLHGFTGTWETWRHIAPAFAPRHHVIMPDLPGHGETPLTQVGLWELADALSELVRQLSDQPAVVCGYSMGGRIALHFALSHPDLLNHLALAAASPGIEPADERALRARADSDLADQLLDKGQEWFTSYWESQPILATQRGLPEATRSEIRRLRFSCPVDGLAYTLRHWSSGIQDCLLPRLAEIGCPVLLLAGEWDVKYVESNRRMKSAFARTRVSTSVIPESGHAIVWENPSALIDALMRFAA